jgi:hypothetical protein
LLTENVVASRPSSPPFSHKWEKGESDTEEFREKRIRKKTQKEPKTRQFSLLYENTPAGGKIIMDHTS